jgi:hypothetical protein
MANLPEVCLLECLMPPPGYHLECMVGTTYSLNPSIFLSMLVAANTPRLGDESFALEDRSKEEILNAIRDGAGKCLVFCDHHGALQENDSFGPLEKLILNSVVKKEGRANNLCGSLHGKVLVVLFKNEQGQYRGRLYVGSKNFTATAHDEFGLVVEFEPTKSQQSDTFCKPLTDYLSYLQDWEAARVRTEEKLRPLHDALRILKTKRFRCVIPDLEFHWQGRTLAANRPQSWIALANLTRQWLGEKTESVYIHSPWVRKGAIDHFLALSGKRTKFFLRCLDDPQLAISSDSRVSYEFYHGSNGQLSPHHSHAKIYLFKRGREALLAFGSANFTPDGWGLSGSQYRPNAEILVTVPGTFAAFRQLADIVGQQKKERIALPKENSAADDALDFLGSIRVDVDYDSTDQMISYVFQLPEESMCRLGNVEISQDLIESYEDRNRIVVWGERGLPPTTPISIRWNESLLYLLSPVMRLRDPCSGVEVHVVLDLELRFFNGREKLRCLNYTPSEFVMSLARLMEFQLDGTSRGSTQGSSSGDDVGRFVRALRLERYLYRMGRLKHKSLAEFKSTLSRIERLLQLRPDDPRLLADHFVAALEAIEHCHQVLYGA